MPTQRLTDDIIAAAIEGFEAQKKRIDGQIAELRSFLTTGPAENLVATKATSKRGKFSDATKLRMKQAQQRRWARIKGDAEPLTPAPVAVKAKRKFSEAGRQAIAEASRRRWAAIKSAKETPGPSAAKKAARKKAPVKTARAKKAAAKMPTV